MKLYAFNDSGGLYEVNINMCDNPAQIISTLIDSSVIYAGHLANGVHCAIVSANGVGQPAFIKEASHIRMNSMFSCQPDIDGSGELRHYIDYVGGVKAQVDWVVPDGYRLFFTHQVGGAISRFHMIMVNPDGNFAMIPMSNCYEDCRVCSGSVQINPELPLVEAFDVAMDAFWSSYWNEHETMGRLFSDHNRFIFRWDIEMNQLPMVDPYEHMKTTSPSFVASSAIANVMKCQEKPIYGETTDNKAPLPRIIEAVTEGIEEDEDEDR